MHSDTYVVSDPIELPLQQCYGLTVDVGGLHYYVRLVPSSMPGWTYDAFVFDEDQDDTDAITYVHAVSIPGIEDPTPQDYALAAVREVRRDL